MSSQRESDSLRLNVDPNFWEDLQWWVEKDRNVALRIFKLVTEIQRTPFQGIGKPEKLGHLDANTWSRRIMQEHRLVYRVEKGNVDLLMCRYHY